MSAGVRITKEGLKSFKWDGTIREYVEEKVESYIPKLRNSCRLDLGVTLGDIFDAVEQHPDLKAFIGMYSWCNMNAFHKEAKREPLKKSDLEYLEISRYFEDGTTWDNFDGMGKPENPEDGTELINYGIGFTPVSEMVHLEVRLNPKCSIQEDYKEVGTTKTCYSLLEVLDAIYWEISFYGNPPDRDTKMAELQEMVKEIKAGTAKTVPWDEIKRKDVVQ
jgi:hypothetical protein